MYNDTIKVANKIITYDDLFEIFSQMNEKLIHYKKIHENEERKNNMLEYNYQSWSFKDTGSKLQFEVNFSDDTQIKFDNYNNFISAFNNRLDEIKSIYVHFNLSYSILSEGKSPTYYNQYIHMWIYEHKMDIDVSLSSEDKKIDDIYELIKNKVLSSPAKYDEVIKKKSLIITSVGAALGFIPAFIITSILIFVPNIRQVYESSYVIYPLACLILTFFFSGTIGSFMLDKYYKTIIPEKKYAGYDVDKGTSIYKDDINKYVATSEILIGKNAHNLECRNHIKDTKAKYQKWLPYELGILLLISILVLFLGNI